MTSATNRRLTDRQRDLLERVCAEPREIAYSTLGANDRARIFVLENRGLVQRATYANEPHFSITLKGRGALHRLEYAGRMSARDKLVANAVAAVALAKVASAEAPADVMLRRLEGLRATVLLMERELLIMHPLLTFNGLEEFARG